MAEKDLVIDGLELNYKGLFEVKGLLKEMDHSIGARGYVKEEKKREERVSASGKEFSIELRPVKVKTQYYSLMIKMRVDVTGLRDVEVVKDGRKEKMNQGNVHIIFDAWTTTDYENRWEQTPWYFFLRTLFEKGIYKYHTNKYHDELSADAHFIYDNVKAYLELHKF